jgi:hypothetical protein
MLTALGRALSTRGVLLTVKRSPTSAIAMSTVAGWLGALASCTSHRQGLRPRTRGLGSRMAR